MVEPTSVDLSKVLLGAGISASSILSGFLICLSHVSIPSILHAKDLSERQVLTLWRATYFKGFHLSPPLALLSGVSFTTSILLFSPVDNGIFASRTQRSLLAGLCCIAVVPYTIFFVAPTNRVMMARLEKLEREDGKVEQDDTAQLSRSRELVGSWARLNFGRFLLPFIGSFLAWSAW